MAGFLKRLFGGDTSGANAPAATEEYEGFVITAEPISDSGQFRLAGSVTKEVNGEMREHKFIRADLFPTKDQADEFAMHKGKQMIDQLGDRIFQQ
jgi:hypothetical protein